MEFLPWEMFEEILRYCSSQDLVSLSCCSRSCYNLTKRTLWSKANVQFCRYRLVPDFVLQNLTLTSQLVLGYTSHKILQPRRKTCEICNLVDEVALKENEQLDSGQQLSTILEACNPSKIETLCLRSMSASGFGHAVTRLNNVRNLSMHGCLNHDWENVIRMKKLQYLSLYNIRSLEDHGQLLMPGFKRLLQTKKLHGLTISLVSKTIMDWIGLCNSLRELTLLETMDSSLEPLEALKSLRKLRLRTTSKLPISVRPISACKELRELSVEGYSFKDNAMKHICSELKSLQTVNLSAYYQCWDVGSNSDVFLYDRHFSPISELSSLKSLTISECRSLRGPCLEYISKCKSLRELTINDRVNNMKGGCYIWPYSKFYALNRMDSLRKFVMVGNLEVVSLIIKAMLKKQKKKMEQWKFHVTEDQDRTCKGRYCYTLTR